MPKCLHFYVDDSGSRNPDHAPDKAELTRDFFAMGGVLVNEEDEGHPRRLHDELCHRWRIGYPLHSVDIRHSAKSFSWLHSLEPAQREKFYSAIHHVMRKGKVLALACVIDRPGYNARYRDRYGAKRWMLCKTAVAVVLERAVRVAMADGRKLRVFVEKCSKIDDQTIRGYYEELREKGLPFEPKTSAKYGPLGPDDFRKTLYDLKFKEKSSPLIQLADLALYPLARGGYEPEYVAYRKMMQDGCVIDCRLSDADRGQRGVKYSCFDRTRSG